MPDPEETEREALEQAIAKALVATSPAVDVGAIATFVSLSGFRRLSESEMRRDQAEKDAGIALALDQSVGGVGQWYDGHSAGVNDAAASIRAQFTPSPETEQEPE